MNAQDLPDVARARLPVNYSAACTALAECHRIDECKEWANQAQALASYARQAKDDSLRKTADRIQARAVRRCGELLKGYDARGGDHKSENKKGRTSPSDRESRAQAGTRAGLSPDQVKDAVRVANVEPELFHQQVESENPPTVTELAEQGKKPQSRKLIDLGGIAPADFKAATQAAGWVHQLCEVIARDDLTPEKIVRGLQSRDVPKFHTDLMKIGTWAAMIINTMGALKNGDS